MKKIITTIPWGDEYFINICVGRSDILPNSTNVTVSFLDCSGNYYLLPEGCQIFRSYEDAQARAEELMEYQPSMFGWRKE